MTKRLTIALLALAIFVVIAVLPVSASYRETTINPGATVFIGESNLSMARAVTPVGGVSMIAWFPSTATTTATTPEKTIDVTATAGSFYVNPADFSSRAGNWYCWTAGNMIANSPLAFYAADPSIDVKIWDLDQAKDVSGKSVPAGERLTFRVETNMYPVVSNVQRLAVIPTWTNNTAAAGFNGTYYGLNQSITPQLAGQVNDPKTAVMTTDGYIDIKVKTDQGATLNRLFNNRTDGNAVTYKAIPLTGLFVDNQPWYWGNTTGWWDLFWDTGAVDSTSSRIYPGGVYTVTAEVNLNLMKDNYKNNGADYAGKTVTEARTITLVSDTVAITANKDSVVRSKPFSVTVTGKPSTFYWVWVKNTGQMTGAVDAQPPMIPLYQTGVYNDLETYKSGAGVSTFSPVADIPQNGVTVGLYSDVPRTPSNGTQYWAMIKTNENGVRTIEFSTTKDTKAQKYTIRVENYTIATGYKTDEVDVKVEKGAVTITASGDGSYYLGEEVKFSGTNTETAMTYLFLVGPNLPSDGASFIRVGYNNVAGGKANDPRTNPVQNGNATSFQNAVVKDDNTWSWKWGTATVALDAGTYTVYAVSAPRDKGVGHLADVAYGTVSIIIKKPFVSATVSQSTVAKGDKIFVRGTAEGKPAPGVMMWIMGKNYATQQTASVGSDASFEFEIKDSVTSGMTSGQYFVVVQHPMQNNVFDINLCTDGVNICNLQLSTNTTLGGTKIFSLLGQGSLQGSDAAEALAQGINDPNVDDTYTKLQFLIEEPIIKIDPIGDRHVGDKFSITAQTNLAVDDEVLFEVYSSSFKPTQKSQSGEFSGATGTQKVTKGDTGMNKLSFAVDASTFKPDEYIVTATRVLYSTTSGSALFNVLEGAAPTVAPTKVVTTAAPTTVATTVAPTQPPTVAPTKTPTQPGFGALVALIGLGAVAFLVVRRH